MNSKIDWKRIFIFLGITLGVSTTSGVVAFLFGGSYSNYPDISLVANILLLLTAFAPALANIATRLITREGWSNTFLKPKLRHGWPFYLAALILPLLAIILGGVIYYLLFPGKFDLSMTWARQTGLVPADLIAAPWTAVISHNLLSNYRMVLTYSFFILLGEEFGWRAYLLPKLMSIGPRKAFLLTGAIWGMYHWPFVLLGWQYGLDYWGAPVAGPLLFVLFIMSPSILFSWVAIRTGSVWPACIAHAVHSAISPILMVFFHNGKFNSLIGPLPEGVVGCLGYVLIAIPIFLSLRAFLPVSRILPTNPGAAEITTA